MPSRWRDMERRRSPSVPPLSHLPLLTIRALAVSSWGSRKRRCSFCKRTSECRRRRVAVSSGLRDCTASCAVEQRVVYLLSMSSAVEWILGGRTGSTGRCG